MNEQNITKTLESWYRAQRRPLPWRQDRDPYRIWVSEVMLQQTTIRAVIPYYERFMARFPTLQALASAEEGDVLALWSGLGYYSRARNLLRAAGKLAHLPEFPRSYRDLLPLPGFGPYTARAVSSIAFDEPVGVLDGNVIRVLSRLFARAGNWWLPRERAALQELVDGLASFVPSGILNQALMDLGATVCTPQNPSCALCPLIGSCRGYKRNKVMELPRPRPRRERENWLWQAELIFSREQVAFVRNDYAPFLRGQWLCPGRAVRVAKRPNHFHFRHTITHHDIFVTVHLRPMPRREGSLEWIHREEIPRKVPASIVKKVVIHGAALMNAETGENW